MQLYYMERFSRKFVTFHLSHDRGPYLFGAINWTADATIDIYLTDSKLHLSHYNENDQYLLLNSRSVSGFTSYC